jgi:hypothetical protein
VYNACGNTANETASAPLFYHFVHGFTINYELTSLIWIIKSKWTHFWLIFTTCYHQIRGTHFEYHWIKQKAIDFFPYITNWAHSLTTCTKIIKEYVFMLKKKGKLSPNEIKRKIVIGQWICISLRKLCEHFEAYILKYEDLGATVG